MSGKTVEGLMELVREYGGCYHDGLSDAPVVTFDAIRTYAEALAAPQARTFSDFIRNATPEEKEAVYREVMDKAAARQLETLAPQEHNKHLCADCTTEHACKNRLDQPRPCGVALPEGGQSK